MTPVPPYPSSESRQDDPKVEPAPSFPVFSSSPITSQVRTPSAPPWKVTFPCKLCKGDHLLRDCPGIPRILEVWSHDLARPSSSSEAHVDVQSLIGSGKKKGKI